MNDIAVLKKQRQNSIDATLKGAPLRTINQFFGVGPITDMSRDEVDSRLLRCEFDSWIEKNYPKLNDIGAEIGNLITAELSRGIYRDYPADKVLVDMMREIHRYFLFPKTNKLAVGLGAGHSGFTVCALHLLNANKTDQFIFVDTPKLETDSSCESGFFRQSWVTKLIELQRFIENGAENRIFFSAKEGHIPSAKELNDKKIKLFIGVGHETARATIYSAEDIQNLLSWIDTNPKEHLAVIDATSMLGAMPWAKSIVTQVMKKCCMFMPLQKAIGGIAGYFVISLTPEAIDLIEDNQLNSSFLIPHQLKITGPTDAKNPLTSKKTSLLGPIYDPNQDKMLGGIINTFSTLAFAETTFSLLRSEKQSGLVDELNKRSAINRKTVDEWADTTELFELGVSDVTRRGAAVTLLKVTDKGITDKAIHEKIIQKSKQMLGYEGLTHPNGDYEAGLDVARYINVFPGTLGDYRASIGGVRPQADITALLNNLKYAYHRAKIVVLEQLLLDKGVQFEQLNSAITANAEVSQDNPNHGYKILIADLIGTQLDSLGNPDYKDVAEYIEKKGGIFHLGAIKESQTLDSNKLHFFYQPNLSTEAELLAHSDKGQYDAVIAAATFFPKACSFSFGGVRIGTGTGNMGSDSWGGGSGSGGKAALMNTPSFNSRATAQMVFKALLNVCPDLPTTQMHNLILAGNFDTGKNLCEFPTQKIEGKRMAIIGYGNIGREVAKLAKAFGIEVIVYARAEKKSWIESEGCLYASSILKAATCADIISPHVGLGSLNSEKNAFSNTNLITKEILNALNDEAIVINYDRGEIINAKALDDALASGKVSHAAIDADLFKNATTGEISGSMVPYLALVKKYPDKMALLPHAAADTDHLSRVQGAKQAVNQIFDAIVHKKVVNLVGDLPKGYVNAGSKTIKGVGMATIKDIRDVLANPNELHKMRELSESMSAFWGAIEAIKEPFHREELAKRYSSNFIHNANEYSTLLAKFGLEGLFKE